MWKRKKVPNLELIHDCIIFYRKVDREGEFSGDDVAFIYPDFATAVRGKFEKEQVRRWYTISI